MEDHGACKIISRYCWVLFLLDCSMMLVAYFIALGWCKDPWVFLGFPVCITEMHLEGAPEECQTSDTYLTNFVCACHV